MAKHTEINTSRQEPFYVIVETYDYKSPRVIRETLRETRKEAVGAFVELAGKEWKELYKLGYRCRKVVLKEVRDIRNLRSSMKVILEGSHGV